MREIIFMGVTLLILIKLVLKHNKDFSYIKIKLKFIGLDIEIQSKEKKNPSNK